MLTCQILQHCLSQQLRRNSTSYQKNKVKTTSLWNNNPFKYISHFNVIYKIVANVTRAKALIINIISNSGRNTANQMFLVKSVILRASPVFFLSCFLIVSELMEKEYLSPLLLKSYGGSQIKSVRANPRVSNLFSVKWLFNVVVTFYSRVMWFSENFPLTQVHITLGHWKTSKKK